MVVFLSPVCSLVSLVLCPVILRVSRRVVVPPRLISRVLCRDLVPRKVVAECECLSLSVRLFLCRIVPMCLLRLCENLVLCIRPMTLVQLDVLIPKILL